MTTILTTIRYKCARISISEGDVSGSCDAEMVTIVTNSLRLLVGADDCSFLEVVALAPVEAIVVRIVDAIDFEGLPEVFVQLTLLLLLLLTELLVLMLL